jgi:predicted nucleotide-binding protein
MSLDYEQEDDMVKGRTSKTYSSSPKLVVPREEAIRRIKEQIAMGHGVRDQRMFSMMDLESAQKRRGEWVEKNIEMLTRLVNNTFFKEEYEMGLSFDMDSAITFSLKEKYFRDDINEHIGRLESFLERLKLIPEMKGEEIAEHELIEEPIRQEQPREIQPKEVQPSQALVKELKPTEEPPKEKPVLKKPPKEEPSEKRQKLPKEEPSKEVPQRREPLKEEPPPTMALNQSPLQGENILLIHGRDEAAKESVSKFIEALGLRVFIPHKQPNGGRGILEKFGESSAIHFAIILLTPGEIAALQNRPEAKQTFISPNVMFEFGYLLGKLGHGRVCVLYDEGGEIPLDASNIMYIPLDSRGGWRLLVAKEIKQAGIDIDLNKAI